MGIIYRSHISGWNSIRHRAASNNRERPKERPVYLFGSHAGHFEFRLATCIGCPVRSQSRFLSPRSSFRTPGTLEPEEVVPPLPPRAIGEHLEDEWKPNYCEHTGCESHGRRSPRFDVLAEERADFFERMKTRAVSRAREITYEADVGVMKSRLRTSSECVRWKGTIEDMPCHGQELVEVCGHVLHRE